MIDNPTEGSFQFLGEEVSEYSEAKRAAIRKSNLMVTHSEEMANYSGSVIQLLDGKIVSE